MKNITLTFAFVVALALQGCASTGAGNQEGVAADSYVNATPSEQYIYRSPPPNVVRALR